MRSLKRIALALLLFACALLFPSAEAHADPIEITNGYYWSLAPTLIGNFRSTAFNFSGNNLSLRGGEPDGRSASPVWHCTPSPCGPGSSVTVTHSGSLFSWLPSASLQFNGQSFVGRGTGGLSFVTGEMPWPASGESVVTLNTHFTMTGVITFQALNVSGTTYTWTNFHVADVYGSGVANMTYSLVFGRYYLTGVRYDFQPTATPEPATLLLLGSGLAGLVARHRRRRSRRGSPQ